MQELDGSSLAGENYASAGAVGSWSNMITTW